MLNERKIKFLTKGALIRMIILLIILITVLIITIFLTTAMPGKSYQGDLPSLTVNQQQIREELERDINIIAGVGEHNFIFPNNLNKVAAFLESELNKAGYSVQSQVYQANEQSFRNLEIEIKGTQKPDEIVIIGAHYDSVVGSIGANDNGTGTAAVLSLARKFAQFKPNRTLRFVEFVNEEPPFFWTKQMGSLVYAERCQQQQENIVAMLSLETIGYYSNQENSQQYPLNLLKWFYPSQGNFISFIGNLKSRSLIRNVIHHFRTSASFPSQGVALPNWVPGVGWSDHWSFWQHNYPALMVTDTALFRYPHYHTTEDTPDKINYDHLARVVSGLEAVIVKLVQ